MNTSVSELSGIWVKQYVGFFDTEELKFIKEMANADTLISVWFELMDLAGKLGSSGRFLLHDAKPYTEDMFAASLKRSTPSIRQCLQTFVQFDMLTFEDGIYSVNGWSKMQDAQTLDAIRKGNCERKARERKRGGGGKSASEKKRQKLLDFLTANPGAKKVEMQKATGLSRVTIDKYLTDLTPLLPTPENVQDVQNVQNGVQKSVQNVQNGDVQMYTELYTGLYTKGIGKPAGKQPENGFADDVQILSHPKIIDVDEDIDIDTATSTAGANDRMQAFTPSREEVHTFAAASGISAHLADRFFDVNEGRGWVTNTGKPVDDWKGLLKKWAANEYASAPVKAPSPSQKEPEHAPTVEEVMAKYGCNRETARIMIDEGMA